MNARQGDFPKLTGPYLGQKPPGMTPEPFAPAIVKSGHSSLTISNDGKEIYWAAEGIYFTKHENGRWTKPEVLPFTREEDGDGPKLSPDDQKLYFNSNRPRRPGDQRRERIWCVERTADGWGEPFPLGPEINDEQLHWQVSVDGKGNLYFGSERHGSKGQDDVFMAEFKDGVFENPVSLETTVNSEAHEGSPYVAPDGSYLIFLRDPGLWISFKGEDGRWTQAKKVGTLEEAVCPYVSPDQKYLFFLRAGSIWWVDASVLGLKAAGR